MCCVKLTVHASLDTLLSPLLLAVNQAQNRGGRGKAGAKMSDSSDEVAHFLTCRDHNTLLFVSDRGIAYGIKAFQVRAYITSSQSDTALTHN
jgi:DNA gyrase/topoisomerase IV subunit A